MSIQSILLVNWLNIEIDSSFHRQKIDQKQSARADLIRYILQMHINPLFTKYDPYLLHIDYETGSYNLNQSVVIRTGEQEVAAAIPDLYFFPRIDNTCCGRIRSCHC